MSIQIEELRRLYCEEKKSSVDIGKMFSKAPSTICKLLKKNGIVARTPAEGGRIGSIKNRGKKREFTPEWRANLSAAGLRFAELHAKGTRETVTGYIEYTRGEHKGRLVHVVAMESKIGRRLAKDEVVHHKDEDKTNNDLSNLQLMTRADHTSHHREEEKEHGTGKTKLTKKQVEKIRMLYAAGGITTRLLGERFNVSGKQVSAIIRGDAWK